MHNNIYSRRGGLRCENYDFISWNIFVSSDFFKIKSSCFLYTYCQFPITHIDLIYYNTKKTHTASTVTSSSFASAWGHAFFGSVLCRSSMHQPDYTIIIIHVFPSYFFHPHPLLYMYSYCIYHTDQAPATAGTFFSTIQIVHQEVFSSALVRL